MGAFIVGICDGFESFLSCRIPNLIANVNKRNTYNLTVLPVRSKVLILKSTPIVGKKLSLNTLSENRRSNEDLPTAEFPMRSNLNK